jgi:hypothetical protein
MQLELVCTWMVSPQAHARQMRGMVISLAEIGRCAFPQIHAVIRDIDGNCGIHPVVPMDGEG